MINFYKKLLTYPPYQFQEKVGELLLNGKNVILSVPTGAGKTWASILPFLYALENKIDDFPQKMIYSLPLRTLANSIHQDIDEILEKNSFKNLSSIQTGEYNNDKYFEKDIVFSTIDQTLSNFLSFPLSLSKRQANINAGAIIGSYLVFDEFHLLDTQKSMATTLGMLQMLDNMTRFCIMTATMSDDFIKFIKEDSNLNNIEVVKLHDFPNDIPKIKSLIPPKNLLKKKISVIDEEINAKIILNKHKHKSIIICNRVEKAQQLYINIKQQSPKGIELFCIHSRFFGGDRKIKEKIVKEYFKKNSDKNVILIATQVIEAGMDISCDTLHTEISPINSFLQRAGRCARYEKESGEIYVYDILTANEKEILNENLSDKTQDIKEIKKINSKYLPYDKDLCLNTLKELKKTKQLNEKISECLVNKILTKEEIKQTQIIKNNIFNKKRIKDSWIDCKKSNYKNTIRNIQSVNLVIIDEDKLDKYSDIPFAYESISLYKWSFIGKLKKIKESRNNSNGVVWKLELKDDIFLDEEPYKTSYVLKKADCQNADTDTYYVNSKYFNYSSEIGLNFLNMGGGTSKIISKENKIQNLKPLKKDTFIEHSQAVLDYYKNNFEPKMNFIYKELPLFFNIKNIDIKRLVELMLVFHDYGKLNEKWQKPIKRYQEIKSGEKIKEALAHSDFDSLREEDKILAKNFSKRPDHSSISAFAFKVLLLNENIEERIIDIFSSAISKHHNATSCVEKIKKYNISDNDFTSIIQLLNNYNTNNPLKEINEDFNFTLYENRTIKQTILELLFSRILRISDQKATENIK